MIIKGKSRSGPRSLAAHLGNAETNERVTLLETRGTIATDLRGALIEMEAYAAGTRCEKPLYHAAISPEPPHRLTDRQIDIAANSLELELGYLGHARIIVLHEKLGREHLHIVWSRIDLEKMRAVSDSHNYRKHELVARSLERQFEHERVQGAHVEREGVARPDRTPSRGELRQQERTGIKIGDVKHDITEAYRRSDSAQAFQTAIEDMGYILARGDRRDFVVIDHGGGIHNLGRRIEGMRAAPLREFLSTIDQSRLPSVAQAVSTQHERDANAAFRDYIKGYEQPATLYRRQVEEAKRQAKVAKNYSHGGGYVAQTEAALRHHNKRLNAKSKKEASVKNRELLTRQAGESTKRQQVDVEASPAKPETCDQTDRMEISDAKREAIYRKTNKENARKVEDDRDNPDRQREAPGGGRTRSR